MRKIVAAIVFGTALGVAWAKLPAPPPKSDAEKAAEAEKAKAAKAKEAAELERAQDKAVANYKKNLAAMERNKKQQ
jgi:hypothetical protein